MVSGVQSGVTDNARDNEGAGWMVCLADYEGEQDGSKVCQGGKEGPTIDLSRASSKRGEVGQQSDCSQDVSRPSDLPTCPGLLRAGLRLPR